ncbi:hypothetical protein [Corynebacterium sphenisci]|uniref:hypothetical protein n=1 Tax=Corynebacterium sphenisci TaxID=191493 RepID=UPI0026DF50E9|nr:hypothetical protein [Corynebacterium sphenisci]MDO5730800.1 hypothetical protein [Corynebacterium sphenisci]
MSTPHPENPTDPAGVTAQCLIDRVVDVLGDQGVFCGHCCYGECGNPECPVDAAGWRGCPDCADYLRHLARALQAAGLLATPGKTTP